MECRNGYHEDSDENASASQSQTPSSHEDNQPAWDILEREREREREKERERERERERGREGGRERERERERQIAIQEKHLLIHAYVHDYSTYMHK